MKKCITEKTGYGKRLFVSNQKNERELKYIGIYTHIMQLHTNMSLEEISNRVGRVTVKLLTQASKAVKNTIKKKKITPEDNEIIELLAYLTSKITDFIEENK